jgi:hypothetical protein
MHLLPQTYWIGLRATANSYPNFAWLDSTIAAIPLVLAPPPPPPVAETPLDPVLPPDTYFNWGTLLTPNSSNASEILSFPEPNNFAMPPELCGAANYSQVTNVTWPWTDVGCGMDMPFICRQTREPTCAGAVQWLEQGTEHCSGSSNCICLDCASPLL